MNHSDSDGLKKMTLKQDKHDTHNNRHTNIETSTKNLIRSTTNKNSNHKGHPPPAKNDLQIVVLSESSFDDHSHRTGTHQVKSHAHNAAKDQL